MKLLYPSWRYHATLPARIVETPEESDALGPGWANTPGGAEAVWTSSDSLEDVFPAPARRGRPRKVVDPLVSPE